MKNKLLRKCLDDQVKKLSAATWSESKLASLPFSYDVKEGDKVLHVELSVLAREAGVVRLGVSVDDGSFFRAICPVSFSFFVEPIQSAEDVSGQDPAQGKNA